MNSRRPWISVVVLLTMFAVFAGSATAQTVEVIRSFAAAPNGTHPAAGLFRASDGYLYGTTREGGAHGAGSIFRIDAAGSLSTVHSFNVTDGAAPMAALTEPYGGVLYGTTSAGGDWGFGTVFRWGGGELVTFHSFSGDDGAEPMAGLIYATDGQLYGTTSGGGDEGCGTFFSMDLGDTFTTLHHFTSTEGCAPFATLIQAGDGFLYGTTQTGNSSGTVFKIDTAGQLTTIHEFTGADGAYPIGAMVQAPDGRIFGTTASAGANNAGTLFQLDAGILTTLHHFGGSGGAFPRSDLIRAADGRILGTTALGGASAKGTVFQVSVTGVVTVIHHFNGANGESPYGGVIQTPDGNLFGTTQNGGTVGGGTVFRLAGSNLTTLFNFGAVDGVQPFAGLIQATDGNFYGTTFYGGSGGLGTIFKMDATGALTTIHGFDRTFDPTNGAYPHAGVIQGSDGAFYGTTMLGGTSDQGTIFRLDGAGSLTTLHSFDGTAGSIPFAGLIEGNDGHFYGSTYQGGASGMGTLFRIDGLGNLTTLHSFSFSDGGYPVAALTKADDGRLYGTTTIGGSNEDGTVFRLDTSGILTTIYNFNGVGNEGASVTGALIQAADGLFYGTTTSGGALGTGTMFRMDMTGAVEVLHDFDAAPSGLVQASDGNFYGSTNQGGAMNLGALFRIDALGGYAQFHSFSGSDGESPVGPLLQASDGHLYGVTTEGGTMMEEPGTTNSGVVFRVTLPPGSLTSLASSPNPSTTGQEVTLTATVSGSTGEASGTVEFFNGLTSLGSASLISGTATHTTSALEVGTHQLRARYDGSTSFGPSVSPAVTHVVTEATFGLSVIVSGAGTGTVTSADGLINCPGDCSETYSAGTAVDLNASADAGSVFSGWSDACTGTGACSVTMNADASVTASFAISGADLRETALSNPPSTVVPGGKFTPSDTVTNAGSATAAASTTQYYLSVDTEKDAGDVLIGARAVVSLAGGASTAGSRTVTVPAGTPYGVYYVLVCADDRFKVVETSETNNCLASATTIVVGRPDLAVTALTDPPAEIAGGRTFSITESVTNIGTATAGASTVRYYLSGDAAKDAGDTLLAARAVVSLAAGAASSGAKVVTVPATTVAGVYRVLACADDLLKVVELDEDNCTASAGTMEVKFPDLVETAISNPPASSVPGAKFAITDTVQNQGTITSLASTTRYYFSLDPVKDAGDLLLTGNRAVLQLSPGATFGGTRTVTIPSTMPAGTYYLLACADATQKNIESDEANNCLASSMTIVVGP